MSNHTLFDKLIYVDRLKGAGISEDQAWAHAVATDLALRKAVATKDDLAVLRVDLLNEVARLEHRIELMARQVTIRIGGMLVAAVAILIGLRFFGP